MKIPLLNFLFVLCLVCRFRNCGADFASADDERHSRALPINGHQSNLQDPSLLKIPIAKDVNPLCIRHWRHLLESSKSFRRQVSATVVTLRHPVYVVGSTWPEKFQDCLKLRIDKSGYRDDDASSTPAVGQYCMAYFLHANPDEWTYEEKLIGTKKYPILSQAETLPYLGFCVPSSCSAQDVKYIFEELVKDVQWNVSIKVPTDYCQTEETLPKPSLITFYTLLILFVVCVMVAVGTAIDWWIETRVQAAQIVPLHHASGTSVKNGDFRLANGVDYSNGKKKRSDEGSLTVEILRCFSVYSNLPALLTTEEPPGAIGTLHGLRSISMIGMISAHTLSNSLPFSYRNNVDLSNDDDIIVKMVQNMVLFNDTFFFISGFLAAFTHLKKMKNNGGHLGIFTFYWYRYLRLTPPYAFCIALTVGVFVLYSGSPTWPRFVHEVEHCRENWWLNMLYINNIFKTDAMCQLHFWYLATDMQLHLLAPLLLYPLYKFPRFGIFLAFCCLAMSNITHGWLTYIHDLPTAPFVFDNIKGETVYQYVKDVHFPAYIKLGSYAIGMVVGRWILLHGKKIKLNKTLILILWPPMLVLGFGISMLANSRWYNPGRVPPSRFEIILYNSVSRAIWCYCLTWLVVTHHVGVGGIVTKLLSWRFWTPLSKLTYCVYLIHYNVLFVFFYSRQVPLDYNRWNVYTYFAAAVFTSYALAIPFSLGFEFPALRLVKLMEKRNKR